MASNHVIRTARLTDRQILGLMDVLKEELEIVSGNVGLGLGKNIPIQKLTRGSELVEKLDRDSYRIFNSTVNTASGISIHFLRGICANTENPHNNRTASPYFDEIILTANQAQHDIDEPLKCLDIIQDSLPKIYPLQNEGKERSVVDIFQTELATLTNQYGQLLTGLDAERAEFRKTFEEERKRANKEFQTAKKNLENDDNQRRKEFENYKSHENDKLQSKVEELQNKIEELNKREESLDDRQYMHTRRELRNQITKNFKDRVGQPVVSKRAWNIQWLIFGLTLIAGIAAGYLSFESYQDLLVVEYSPEDQWKTVGLSFRLATLTIAAVVFVFYAINWLKGIYIDHVRTDRGYESFGNDIDRASFVIETILEVGEKERAAVPDTWIAGVCRNLFTEKGNDSYDTTSSNLAVMLLESISGANFRSDGAEINFKGRGARKLAKKLKKK